MAPPKSDKKKLKKSSKPDENFVLAQKLAHALITEIDVSFVKKPTPGLVKNWAKDFVDINKKIDRKDFTFQSVEGVYAPKRALGNKISDEAGQNIYCAIHGDFVFSSCIDIDHSVAYSEIEKNIIRFTNFLNDSKNLEVANHFLSKVDVQNFFRKDLVDNVIKPTKYLFKVCYNKIDNLWLLCHGCNIQKSDSDLITWIKKSKNFEEQFEKDFQSAGGLKQGLIFKMVGGKEVAEITYKIKKKLGAENGDKNKDQQEEIIKYPIYSGGTYLGEFTREWFMRKNGDNYQVHRNFYSKNYKVLKEQLEQIKDLEKRTNKPALFERKILSRQLRRALYVQETTSSEEDISSEDTTESMKEREKKSLETLCKHMNKSREKFRFLKHEINRSYTQKNEEAVLDFVSDIADEAIDKFPYDIEDFCNAILNFINRKEKDGFEVLKKHMMSLIQEFSRPKSELIEQCSDLEDKVKLLESKLKEQTTPSLPMDSHCDSSSDKDIFSSQESEIYEEISFHLNESAMMGSSSSSSGSSSGSSSSLNSSSSSFPGSSSRVLQTTSKERYPEAQKILTEQQPADLTNSSSVGENKKKIGKKSLPPDSMALPFQSSFNSRSTTSSAFSSSSRSSYSIGELVGKSISIAVSDSPKEPVELDYDKDTPMENENNSNRASNTDPVEDNGIRLR